MSLSGNEEISEYNFIINNDFLTNLIKLKNDLLYNRDIKWMYNRFIPCDLYYNLIDSLTINERKKFNNISSNLSIQTTSNLSFEELELLNWEMLCDDKNDYDDLEDDNEDIYIDADDNLFTFKKSDKE